jgi:hypothetical protein
MHAEQIISSAVVIPFSFLSNKRYESYYRHCHIVEDYNLKPAFNYDLYTVLWHMRFLIPHYEADSVMNSQKKKHMSWIRIKLYPD